MNFEGGQMEGFSYGDLSPFDYNGLKLWLRATDGITFSRGNFVLSWRDLSAGILFTGASPTGVARDGAGGIYQTENGLAYGANSGDSWIIAKGSSSRFNFLVNGSPSTAFIIMTLNNVDTAGANVLMCGVPQVSVPNYGIFQTANIASRHPDANNTSMYNLDIPNSNLFVGQKVIYTETNYGYGSGQNPLMFNTVDGSTVRTASPAFLTPPDPNAVFGGSLGFYPTSSRRYLYEIIIYDHTGKTKAQIDFETANLVNNYIKKRYPGF